VSTWANKMLGLTVITTTAKNERRLVFMVRTSAPIGEDSNPDSSANKPGSKRKKAATGCPFGCAVR
jgi:hypothetical protein